MSVQEMSEETLSRIQAMIDNAVASVRGEVHSVRDEVHSVRDEVHSVRGEVRSSEERLAEGGRLQFRQLAELYRATVEKVEHLEKHLSERIDATRGSIESLRSSLERHDFRADELGRRITSLETREDR